MVDLVVVFQKVNLLVVDVDRVVTDVFGGVGTFSVVCVVFFVVEVVGVVVLVLIVVLGDEVVVSVVLADEVVWDVEYRVTTSVVSEGVKVFCSKVDIVEETECKVGHVSGVVVIKYIFLLVVSELVIVDVLSVSVVS